MLVAIWIFSDEQIIKKEKRVIVVACPDRGGVMIPMIFYSCVTNVSGSLYGSHFVVCISTFQSCYLWHCKQLGMQCCKISWLSWHINALNVFCLISIKDSHG